MIGPAARAPAAPGGAAARLIAGAAASGARAAAAAGVGLELAEAVPQLEAVARFLAEVWQTPPGQPPLAPDVLRAIVHAGGAVHVARQGEELAGAAAMIFCGPSPGGVYSLIAGARHSGRGVGFALKQAQRAWALERGATSMMWTFDPLVSRNARFNLAKLGAVAAEYEVNFYGLLNDGIDGQGETDRLAARWPLAVRRAVAAADGDQADVAGPDLARCDVDSRPAPDGGPLLARDSGGWWCRVPAEIVALRRSDRPLADRWRLAVREALLAAFSDGHAATGFSRDGWYRLTRRAAEEQT